MALYQIENISSPAEKLSFRTGIYVTFLNSGESKKVFEITSEMTAYETAAKLRINNLTDVIIADKDNATSFRLRGLQESSEGSSKVQSYSGMFTNTSYDTVGTLKTRASYGANSEMDLVFQSPHALLLIAQDGVATDGVVKALTQNGFEVHPQYSAEELSPKHFIVNRVSTANKGSANTSDVTAGTNDGKLHLQHGHVTGGVVFSSYTTGERDALTPVAGEVVFNSTTSILQAYDGSSWKDLHA